MCVGTADVAEQRQLGRLGRSARNGQGDAEDRVGAQSRLARRAVEVDERLVDEPLLAGLEPDQHRADLVEDRKHGLLDTLAAVAFLVAVAQLGGLERAGAGPARHCRPGDRAVIERDLDLDGGVAARVEDLAGADGVDARHGGAPSYEGVRCPVALPRPGAVQTVRLPAAQPSTVDRLALRTPSSPR